MATLATFFRRSEFPFRAAEGLGEAPRARAAAGPYTLRALPNEDVYFYCKRIDNSRVVREADPHARGECWSAIGVACVIAALLTSIMVPNVGGIIAGYKLQALRIERQKLLDERTVLEVEEARLLNPARLGELAKDRRLVSPAPGQVVHLEGKNDAALARAASGGTGPRP